MSHDKSHQSPVIRTERVSKWYGYVIGLNEVSIDIGAGVTALLGPNGAGKSTFMKLVAGLLRPNQGAVTVLGGRPWGNPTILERIGYCSEKDAVFPGLTGRDLVQWSCRLRGMGKGEAAERAAAALERLDLTHAADRKMGTYSKGMRQRARLAAVDALDLDLYVLDEPTTGTDPVVRQHIVDWIRDLGDRGKAVLVSSHNLAEVEQMTDRLVLILGGRVRAAGSREEIHELLASGVAQVVVHCGNPRPLAAALCAREDVRQVSVSRDRIEVTTTARLALAEDLPRLAEQYDAGLTQVVPPSVSLGELFRSMTKRGALTSAASDAGGDR